MIPRTYVSVSRRPTRRGGERFRVVVKHLSGTLNSLDSTLAERIVGSKHAADCLAGRWAREFKAEILGKE
jgi:hypothetical protein